MSVPPLSSQQLQSFAIFKKRCAEQGLLDAPDGSVTDDVRDGINDEATLLYDIAVPRNILLTSRRRFFRCRQCDVHGALRQYQEARKVRQVNHLCEFYENIDVKDYQETADIVRSQHSMFGVLDRLI